MEKATATPNNKLPVPQSAGPMVKALVFELPHQKPEGTRKKGGKSKQIPEDVFATLLKEKRILEPPFDLYVLSTLPEYNTELEPCLDAMETNIDGFGHRLIPRVDVQRADEKLAAAVKAEKVRLENFFLYAGTELSFRQLRYKRRRDLEKTGNAYWEVVRGARGEIQFFAPIRSYQMRLTAQDAEAQQADMPILELQPDGKSLKIRKIKVFRRFRRFVQVSTTISGTSTISGYKKVWFKQLGDPRVVDKDSGEIVPPEKQKNYNQTGKPMPESQMANEVVHWALNDSRSPYGLPRFIGVLLDIFGDRKASEVNYITLCNNNMPSMVVAVSNGQLTEETIDRIRDFMEKLQGDDNRSKVLVLEAEGATEDGEDSGHIKIEMKPLTKEQIGDALFVEYGKSNREKVRVAFRLPPILIGRTQDYNRATAETSRRLADEQVFAPEREDFDDWINRILFPLMGVVYHQYRSNSPNTTDNAELVKILAGAEKTGGMTPRIARMVLEDILGKELDEFPEGFDPNVPFSLTMAEAVKNQADPTEPGQQVTALKRLKMLTDLVGEEVGGGVVVQTLLDLRKALEDEWSKELFAPTDEAEGNDE